MAFYQYTKSCRQRFSGDNCESQERVTPPSRQAKDRDREIDERSTWRTACEIRESLVSKVRCIYDGLESVVMVGGCW
jgi:hypothetical protein